MDIIIRDLNEKDHKGLLSLINNELGYPNVTYDELKHKIKQMQDAGNYRIYVAVTNKTKVEKTKVEKAKTDKAKNDKTETDNNESENEITGFLSTVTETSLEITGDYIRIIGLAVSEKHQGKGVGGLLLQHMEKEAAKKGVKYFVVNSALYRTDAHVFYEKAGYIKSSLSFYKGSKKG